jgi:cytochrome c oxidase cbb3-type subunit 3
MKLTRHLRSALPLILLASATHAQTGPNPFAGNAPAAEAGRKLFGVSCAPCHGRTGEGGRSQAEGTRPPDLTRGVFQAGNRDEDLYGVISKGIPAGGMPSFEPLGSADIWRLVTFIRTLSRSNAAVSGDAAAGETLFWGKGNCGQCHAIGSRGTSLGPDLAHAGRRSTPQRVKHAIVAPEDEITPGYEMVTVVMRNRKTVTGLARYFDDFSTRIIDASGEEHTYLRDEVASMRRELRSTMPGNYGKIFSDADVDNLVAYIMKVRREAMMQ